MRTGAASLECHTGQSITLQGWILRPSLRGIGWAAVSVTVFSGWLIVTRFSVAHELRVRDVMALRLGVGALVLLPALFDRTTSLPSRTWLEGLSFAALWGAPFVFFVSLGLELTSAAQVCAIEPALMPIFAGLIRSLTLREPPGGLRRPGYLVITGGMAALEIGNALSDGRNRHHCPSPRNRRGAGRSRSREIPSGFEAMAIGAAMAVGQFRAPRHLRNIPKLVPPQENCRDPFLFPPHAQSGQGRTVS